MIEWIPHDSDECPVKPGSLVEVCCDYGAQITTLAENVLWAEVTRYRDELPVVIAPSGYPMPAEANRCTYIPDEAGGIVSLGPVLLVEPT